MKSAIRLTIHFLALTLLAVSPPLAAQTTPILIKLHDFVGTDTNGMVDGIYPGSALVLGRDGDLYGTTYGGLGGYNGTVFKITPAGVLTTLHEFAGADPTGENPYAGLILGRDGNFYGTTYFSGSGGSGTVFKMTPAGALTALHSFPASPADGANPAAALVQGGDGNFYGTTLHGGDSSNGTVFKMTPAGVLTVLHNFTGSGTDGAKPYAALIQGSDGNLYGTTSAGGSGSNGTVFKVTSAGVFTSLHSFASGTEGATPLGEVVQGSNGNFYGTTSTGGVGGYGTVFKMTPAGVLTVLHSFTGSGTDGAESYAALIQGSDGNFYGTTLHGGGSNMGTLFKMTPAGVLTTLYEFSGGSTDGAYPHTPLVQASDGSFYGTTFGGGSSDKGTVFRFAIVPTPAFQFAAPSYNTTENAGLFSVPVVRTGDTSVPLAVSYKVGGTAVGGKDYRTLSGVLNMAAGVSVGTIDVLIFRRDVFDGSNHTLTLDLLPSGDGSYLLTDDNVTTLKILDADIAPPTTGLLTPVNGLNLKAGSTLTLTAGAAADAVTALDHVVIYVDGVAVATFDGQGKLIRADDGGGPVRRESSEAPVGNAFSAPYTLPGTDKLLNLLVVAFDKLGLASVSGVAKVHSTVTSDKAPLVAISNLGPTAQLKVDSVNAVNVTASDPDAVQKIGVEGFAPQATALDAALAKLALYVNGALANLLNDPPAAASFSFTPLAAGKFVLHSVATDGSGLSTISDPVVVTAIAPTVTVMAAGDGVAVEHGGQKGKVVVTRTGDTSDPLTVVYKAKGSAKADVDYKPLPGFVTIPAGASKTKIKIKPLDNPEAGTRKVKIKLLPAGDRSYEVGDPFLAKIKVIDNG